MTETQLEVVSEKKSNLLTHPNKIWSNRCSVCTGTAGSRRFFLNLASFVAPSAFLPKTSFPGLWVYCLTCQKLQVLTKRKGALPLSSSLKQKFRKNWTSWGQHTTVDRSPIHHCQGWGIMFGTIQAGQLLLWLVPPHTASLAEWGKEHFSNKRVSGFGSCHFPLGLLHGCLHVSSVNWDTPKSPSTSPHRGSVIVFTFVLGFLPLHPLLRRAWISFGLFSQGTKGKEVLMGSRDFQGNRDNMVEMDFLEEKGIQAPQYV